MAKFIKAARFLAEDENGFVIGEADTYEEAQAFGGRVIDTQSTENVFQSRKIFSSQKGFENVVEGTQYDDYHIDTNGMGILSVENVIEEIEGRGNQAVLTVQTSDGSTNHSQFGSKDWKEYKDSVNDAGNAITDVWVTEVKGGSYVRNSRRAIKSEFDKLDRTYVIDVIDNIVHYHNKNLTKEQYYLLDDLLDKLKNKTATSDDCVEVLTKIVKYHNKNLTKEQYYLLDDLLEEFHNFDNSIQSSRRPVKSSHSGDTFLESYKGFDIYMNLTEEGNFDCVHIYDSSTGDEIKTITSIDRNETGYRMADRAKKFIDSYITSSCKITSSDKNLEKELVTKILSGKFDEEKAARVIAMSKKCNLGYAKQILSTWIEERSPSLIKNGVRHVVLNNVFDPDGNIDSWSMDFVPQSGMADTKAGEILRAFNQIQCSWFNHGYKVGDYKGSEYVNSAARFLKSHTDEKISKLLESATRCHNIESYDNMIQSMRTSLENYLCNNSHLFQSVNEEDMWDEFSPEDNDSGELDDVKLVNGNSFIEFKNEDGSWVCTKINVDTEYNEGDTFTLEDDIAENFEAGDGEYGDFVSEGIHYSWESLNDNEYRINGVSFEDDYFVEDSDYTSDEIISYCADNPDWVLCNKDNDEVDMDYFN